MLSITLAFAAQAALQPAPIDFKLAWKKDQAFTYALNVSSAFGKSEGSMAIKVTAVDEKTFTLTWPQVAMSGGMQPVPGGSQKLSPRGLMIGMNEQASLFMIGMALPGKPTAPGGTYAVKYEGMLDMTFTFVKLDETKGRKAHFSSVGKLTARGGSIDVKTESVFDLDSGVFLSGQTQMSPGQNTFSFKLVE